MGTQSAVTGDALQWAFNKLGAAFPGSFPDDDAIAAKALLWRELMDENPWITAGTLDVEHGIWTEHGVFDMGVRAIAFGHAGGFLPPPAEALDYFHQAKGKLDRLHEQASLGQALKALPPPQSEHALTEQEVQDVVWIRNWYARTLAMRRDAAWLDERLDPPTLAFQRDCERYEDIIGHIPDLPPEQLKAALARYAGGRDRTAVAPPPVAQKQEGIGVWPR